MMEIDESLSTFAPPIRFTDKDGFIQYAKANRLTIQPAEWGAYALRKNHSAQAYYIRKELLT